MIREEAKAALGHRRGEKWRMASLMYGSGLCRTMAPQSLKPPLRDHLAKIKGVHDEDRAADWGRVHPPAAQRRH